MISISRNLVLYSAVLAALFAGLLRAETNSIPVTATLTTTPPVHSTVQAGGDSGTNSPATLMLNFEDADIRTILVYLAQLTGETIIPTPSLKGTVTIISPKPVTPQTAKQIIYSALMEQGYTLVRMKHGIKVIRKEDAKSSPIPITPSSRN